VLKYAINRRGLLSESAVQLFAYAKSGPQAETADLQFSFTPASMRKPEPGQQIMKADDQPGMTLCSCPLRPKSRGYVHITSADPSKHPLIQFGYLDHREDQIVQIAGLRLGRTLAAQPALAPYLEGETLPGPEFENDEDLLEHIRESGGSVYHPVGTVRMGSDDAAPLDPRLRVRGIDGLRVVDASAMPLLISGNTNAPTIMIAEKAADLILADDR
ncbi:MAG: choline dehydrogenase, partial [Hyphomicrobiales bacterium]